MGPQTAHWSKKGSFRPPKNGEKLAYRTDSTTYSFSYTCPKTWKIKHRGMLGRRTLQSSWLVARNRHTKFTRHVRYSAQRGIVVRGKRSTWAERTFRFGSGLNNSQAILSYEVVRHSHANQYIIGCAATGEACMIGAEDPSESFATAATFGFDIRHVVLMHGRRYENRDHVGGNLLSTFPHVERRDARDY